MCRAPVHANSSATDVYTVSEYRFFTAHQHKLGYSVREDGVEDVIKE